MNGVGQKIVIVIMCIFIVIIAGIYSYILLEITLSIKDLNNGCMENMYISPHFADNIFILIIDNG